MLMQLTFTHAGDLHLGNYQGKISAGGINSRFLDFVSSYQEMIDYTINNKMDFCLITGDLFRTKEPTPSELDAFALGIYKLMNCNIPVVIVLGNHDIFLSEKLKNSIAMFKTLNLKDVIVVDTPRIVTLSLENGFIQIQSMPYQHRNILKLKNHEDVNCPDCNSKDIKKLFSSFSAAVHEYSNNDRCNPDNCGISSAGCGCNGNSCGIN